MKIVILSVLLLCTVVACSGPQSSVTESVSPVETPTLNSLFAVSTKETAEQSDLLAADGTPTLMPYFEQPTASATFRPTEPVNTTPIVSSTPRPTAVVETVTIFGDALNQNWTVDNSYLFDSERDIDVSYNGRYSLAATPRVANAQLIFAVAPDADEEYLRDDVLAVRFWLYSGDDYIATDDLSVTVLGSNEFPYWVEDDDSVQVADDSLPTFSQTRLYFLNVDEDIPPDTWIQIEVWLDDLIFDPDYRYVTGLIIENDDDFIRTIYIDDLELLIEA